MNATTTRVRDEQFPTAEKGPEHEHAFLLALGMGFKCQYCGDKHETTCPQIKAVEYRGSEVVRVELMLPIDYPTQIVGPFGEHEIKLFEGR